MKKTFFILLLAALAFYIFHITKNSTQQVNILKSQQVQDERIIQNQKQQLKAKAKEIKRLQDDITKIQKELFECVLEKKQQTTKDTNSQKKDLLSQELESINTRKQKQTEQDDFSIMPDVTFDKETKEITDIKIQLEKKF